MTVSDQRASLSNSPRLPLDEKSSFVVQNKSTLGGLRERELLLSIPDHTTARPSTKTGKASKMQLPSILLTTMGLVLTSSASVSALAVPSFFPLDNGTFAVYVRHEGHATALTTASASAVPTAGVSGTGVVKRGEHGVCANHTGAAVVMAKRTEVTPLYPFPNATAGLVPRQEGGLRAPATLPALSTASSAQSSGVGLDMVKRDEYVREPHPS